MTIIAIFLIFYMEIPFKCTILRIFPYGFHKKKEKMNKNHMYIC
ncbi:hypothetical protein MC28_E087 (plasmid) [Bacillus thuringiensis MC28]|nr:hypothetical protein MC28_E087 [Bacillus thuringiensis MC28]